MLTHEQVTSGFLKVLVACVCRFLKKSENGVSLKKGPHLKWQIGNFVFDSVRRTLVENGNHSLPHPVSGTNAKVLCLLIEGYDREYDQPELERKAGGIDVYKAVSDLRKIFLGGRFSYISNRPHRLVPRPRPLDQLRGTTSDKRSLIEDGRIDDQHRAIESHTDHESLRAPHAIGDKNDPHLLLDYDPTDFVGRESYLDSLANALVPEPAIILLHGQPGCGKSTLALKFAWNARSSFENVVFQICGQRTAPEIAFELATRLNLDQARSASTDALFRAIHDRLRARPSLLILDDVWDDNVQMLLPGPYCSVLVTSRRTDWNWIGTHNRLPVDMFSTEETAACFSAYLNENEVNRNWAALLSLAERMGRLPLAIAIAARLLRDSTEPVGKAAAGLHLNDLKDVSELLEKAIRAQPEAAQTLLRSIAICSPDSVWLPFAGFVAGLTHTQAREAAYQLVNSSLLRPLSRDRQHFQLHALLREQVRRGLALDELQGRHAIALEQLFGEWQVRWKECQEVLPETLSAMDHLWDIGEVERMEELSAAASELGWQNGALDVSLRIELKRENLWKQRNDTEAKDKLQRSYGNQALVLKYLGRLDDAMTLHKKEEALCMELKDDLSLQICYGNQALVLRRMNKREEAMGLLKRQEEMCLRLNDSYGLHLSYGNQALILTDWERLEEALNLLTQMEPLCKKLENKNTLASNYGNRAEVLLKLGRIDEAVLLLQQQETLSLEIGARSTLGFCYWYWGRAHLAQGNQVSGRSKLQVALEIFSELEMPMEREQIQMEIAEIDS